MSLYVDPSALVKRYVDEPESEACEARLLADPDWVTARHTFVEMHRVLVRVTVGPELARAREAFLDDWERMIVAELDEPVCARAADFATTLGVRTLDALHLAAAHRVGGASLPLLTYDVRQAQAARSLGWSVVGV